MRCITFRSPSPPISCNFLESPGFGWHSAQTLAAQYDIKIQFASKRTIASVLAVPAPLPSDVLQTTGAGDAEAALAVDAQQNKIVCGFGGEVGRMTQRLGEPQTHFVGQVLAWLVLLVVVYAAGECVWTR